MDSEALLTYVFKSYVLVLLCTLVVLLEPFEAGVDSPFDAVHVQGADFPRLPTAGGGLRWRGGVGAGNGIVYGMPSPADSSASHSNCAR